ncbi:DNA topology modulation protein [Alicyclobacillus fodiniaquatilis]|uniref:DNA topology modulation protein n=1 Tax=Alicyclobacillus fodiniaquatilis TaxID=1661150 RepID=A0ABW4JFC1_9BACL
MKKIMIIGSGGSGKSVMARKLGDITKLPVYHLDALFWKPGWVATPNDEWDDMQKELIQRDEWIIDGMYNRTLDIRLSAADTVIFIDLPRWITTYRVIKRRVQYHGKTRPDLHDGCPEKLDWAFVKWVWNFPKNRRAIIMEKIQKHANKNVIILRSLKDIDELIEQAKRETGAFRRLS